MGLETLPDTAYLSFLKVDQSGTIRVGKSKVLLELVINSFIDGASPETIVQRYDTLSLSDVYLTIGYYLKHQQEVDVYLQQHFYFKRSPNQSNLILRIIAWSKQSQ